MSGSPNEAFASLSPENRSSVWRDKMESLLALPLPSPLKSQIEAVLEEVKSQAGSKNHLMTENLAILTKELLKTVPEGDFVEMFVVLDDYDWNGLFKDTEICDECYKNVEVQTESALPTTFVAKAAPCNCNWGCDWFVTVNGGSSEKGCEPTTSGCGPFGTSGCYRLYSTSG